MEDEDPPINAHLRGKALSWAISFIVASEDEFDADDTVEVAQTFYEFLKGDTK